MSLRKIITRLTARQMERDGIATSRDPLPSDVVRLVIAARVAAFEDHIADREVRRELDTASEAFADRVPWENQPEDA